MFKVSALIKNQPNLVWSSSKPPSILPAPLLSRGFGCFFSVIRQGCAQSRAMNPCFFVAPSDGNELRGRGVQRGRGSSAVGAACRRSATLQAWGSASRTRVSRWKVSARGRMAPAQTAAPQHLLRIALDTFGSAVRAFPCTHGARGSRSRSSRASSRGHCACAR